MTKWEFLINMDWPAFDMAKATQDALSKISDPISNFFLQHTMQELYDEAGQRHLRIYPVATTKDMLEDSQLAARNFWVKIEHPELGVEVTYPGPWAVLSETPLKVTHCAPLIGEHNEEIYVKELGFTKDNLCILKEAGVI